MANENVNIQSSNYTFQGHPPQILENTPSSTTANEPPSDINLTLVDVLQNRLNCFDFLFLEVGLLVILTDCMILPSPFLDVTRMSMSTVSFLAQLDSAYRMLSFDL